MRVLIAARLSQKADGQTGIESQDSEARSWAVAHEHDVVDVVPDRKSGTVQPWHRKNLRPWVRCNCGWCEEHLGTRKGDSGEADRTGLYDAVLAYSFDRLSRGDKESTNEIEEWATQHGKTLLTVDGLQFPCEGIEGIRWDLMARLAHQEWLSTSERYKRMQAYLRSEQKLVGRPPFGYEVVCADGCGPVTGKHPHHKTLTPTPEGRKYIPEIYARVIAGDSLGTIARWLNDEGVSPVGSSAWWARSLGLLIRNPHYMGRRREEIKVTDPATGRPRSQYGKTLMRVEPLVDAHTWKMAGLALDTRPKRGPVSAASRAMLSGVLWCPHCADSPMYKVRGGRKTSRRAYYRCSGRGAQRRGCGNLVPVEAVDAAVCRIAAGHFRRPVLVTRVIPGEDHSGELEEIRFAIKDLADRDDLDDEAYDAALAGLRRRRDEVRALGTTPPRVIREESGQTYLEVWNALEPAGRAPFLAEHHFRFYADRNGVRCEQVFTDLGTLLGTWQAGPWADGIFEPLATS